MDRVVGVMLHGEDDGKHGTSDKDGHRYAHQELDKGQTLAEMDMTFLYDMAQSGMKREYSVYDLDTGNGVWWRWMLIYVLWCIYDGCIFSFAIVMYTGMCRFFYGEKVMNMSFRTDIGCILSV